MTKKYNDVISLYKEIVKNPVDIESFQNMIENTAISRELCVLRHKHNKSPKDMAKALDCTVGEIYKIEVSENKDLTIDILSRWASALDLKLNISFK